METVYIEKVIKEFNSEGTIRTFIELALFTLEIFVGMGKCDNTCSSSRIFDRGQCATLSVY